MNAKLISVYRALREAGWGADRAHRAALTRIAWEDADGYTCADYERRDIGDYDSDGWRGPVRIVCHPDDMCDPTDFDGSERDKKEVADRAKRDGCWGYVAEYWTGADWEHADSIWGFVGDDFDGSGYDDDLMQSALDAYDASLEHAARGIEATGPDMYGA